LEDQNSNIVQQLRSVLDIDYPITHLKVLWDQGKALSVTTTKSIAPSHEHLGTFLPLANHGPISKQRLEAAFNLWMDEFLNDPEKFKSTTALALRHAKEKRVGKKLTYGERAATCLLAYLSRIVDAV